MQGFICLWSGAVEDIPAGWHICDGTMGTPDLRNKFIVGAGSTYGVGDAGGSDTYSLAAGTIIEQITPGGDLAQTTTPSLPPYYALAFIMKI